MSSRVRDAAFLTGLTLVGAGSAHFSIGAALIVVGAILLVMAGVGWWGARG